MWKQAVAVQANVSCCAHSIAWQSPYARCLPSNSSFQQTQRCAILLSVDHPAPASNSTWATCTSAASTATADACRARTFDMLRFNLIQLLICYSLNQPWVHQTSWAAGWVCALTCSTHVAEACTIHTMCVQAAVLLFECAATRQPAHNSMLPFSAHKQLGGNQY